MSARPVFAALLVCWCLRPGPARAAFGWRTLETPWYVVFYLPGHEPEAREALAALEANRPGLERLTGRSLRRVPVVIEDVGLEANGVTDPLIGDLHLFTSPPPAGQLGCEHWWSLLAQHENTHLLHLTAADRAPGVLRTVLGSFFTPAFITPAFVDEGYAVFSESRLSPLTGRLNDPFFDGYVGARVQAGTLPDIEDAVFEPFGYPGGNSRYLFGGEFYGWLGERFGADAIADFHRAYAGMLGAYPSVFIPSLGLDRASRLAFGRDFDDLWGEWKRTMHERFNDWREPGDRLTFAGWTADGLTLAGGKLYVHRSREIKSGVFAAFPFETITERDLTTGRERDVVSTTAPIVCPPRVAGATLYYATAEFAHGYANVTNLGFGVETEIRSRSLTTGCDRVVVRDRVRAFAPLPDGSLLYARDRTRGFGSELVRRTPDGIARVLRSSSSLVDELAADGTRVVATARRDGVRSGIFLVDTTTGTLTTLVDEPEEERNPSLAGDWLVFTATYGHRSAIYARDLKSGSVSRLTATGYAADGALDPATGTLYFAGLTGDGQDVFAVKADPEPLVLAGATATPFVVPPLDEAALARGGWRRDLPSFDPFLRLPLAAPAISGDGPWYGGLAMGGDALGEFPSYSVQGLYDRADRSAFVTGGLTSLAFSPVVLDAAASTGTGGDATVTAQVPAFVRLNPGVSSLWLGAQAEAYDRFRRPLLDPFAVSGWQASGTSVLLQLSAPLERSGWGSTRDRTGAYADALWVLYLWHSQLQVAAAGAWDPDVAQAAFAPIRGYADLPAANRGVAGALDLAVPLGRVQVGAWDPVAIWMEGVVLDLFADTLEAVGAPPEVAYGAEVHVETKWTLFAQAIDFGLRESLTRDGSSELSLILGIGTVGAGAGARNPLPVRLGGRGWLAPKVDLGARVVRQ